jgi:hypothetical protein
VGLMDDIEAEQDAATKNRCPVNRARLSLGKDEFAELEKALGNPAYSAAAIARALTKYVPNAGVHGIAAHRKGTCACARG